MVDATGEDRDRATGERRFMGGSVDAAGEPRGDDIAVSGQLSCDGGRQFASRQGGVAGADDGERLRTAQRLAVAPDGEKRRRAVDMAQVGWVTGFAHGDEACTRTVMRIEFVLRFPFGTDAQVALAAAPGQTG